MNAVGIIFSNIHDQSIPEMTRKRTMASVPFGCRYRLIDFPLSNFVNSNISNVGVITHYNYQSLMDHIGTGKDWDLSRRQGGIKILPPYISAFDNTMANGFYTTRLEALAGILNFITKAKEEYAVLSDCDTICNLDLNEVFRFHQEKEADITVVAKKVALLRSLTGKQRIFETDADGRVTDIAEQTSDMTGDHFVFMNIMLLRRDYLQSLVLDAIAHGHKDLFRDSLAKKLESDRLFVFEHKGFHASINSTADYFSGNMSLLRQEVRSDLLTVPGRPIYTKVRNSTPTRYSSDARVSNSLLADGCVIEGTVENSIIFRGVHVSAGCVVRNSILMQDTYCGKNTRLNCVITDKDVFIGDGCDLSGHETRPFYLEKGARI
ncbi:MAG: glucose-1-phosphate adenylyltransferase subunit GlgD [Clostridia bacterium]|nr:glucose-1-phosphate adenylyltransferase subunit GlgD [Clostridia bacterium]